MISKYAFFIWSAYGVSLGALALTTIFVWRAYVKAKALVARLEGNKP